MPPTLHRPQGSSRSCRQYILLYCSKIYSLNFCCFAKYRVLQTDVSQFSMKKKLHCLYVDELIIQLRNSSYGLHIGQLFLGCAFHADDIALLSFLCYGLQRLINICEQYGNAWDI